MKHWAPAALALALTAGIAAAQQPSSEAQDIPEANPGRPTVSTPATITPLGYLQIESGLLAAWHSPEFSSQTSFVEEIRFSVTHRFELLAGAQPFARSRIAHEHANGTGDVLLGAQAVVHQGEGARPTLALSYLHRTYSGDAPGLDIGSASDSLLLMASADVKGFHYDTNYIFNDVADARSVRRAQFGETLSISHGIHGNFGATGEIWHFTQPFLRSRALGTLWALNYNARRNLVFDVGFNRGLTRTSTRWEFLAGFTYLLPHKL